MNRKKIKFIHQECASQDYFIRVKDILAFCFKRELDLSIKNTKPGTLAFCYHNEKMYIATQTKINEDVLLEKIHDVFSHIESMPFELDIQQKIKNTYIDVFSAFYDYQFNIERPNIQKLIAMHIKKNPSDSIDYAKRSVHEKTLKAKIGDLYILLLKEFLQNHYEIFKQLKEMKKQYITKEER